MFTASLETRVVGTARFPFTVLGKVTQHGFFGGERHYVIGHAHGRGVDFRARTDCLSYSQLEEGVEYFLEVPNLQEYRKNEPVGEPFFRILSVGRSDLRNCMCGLSSKDEGGWKDVHSTDTAPKPSTPPSRHQPPPVPPAAAAGTIIKELPDRYRLHQVQYNNGFCTIDWSKELLENGAEKRQYDWLWATQTGEWKLPDAPLVFASLRHLYQNQNHADQQQRQLVEKVRAFFKAGSGITTKPQLATSSKVRCTAQENDSDLVSHCFGYLGPGLSCQRDLKATILGPDGYITAHSGMGATLEALLGTSDGAEVETVGKWINGKRPFLSRPGRKSSQQDSEYMVTLDIHDDLFIVNVYIHTITPLVARGVAVYPVATESLFQQLEQDLR